MKNFEKEVYNFLSSNEGFYMQQYFSSFHKDNKWIAIKSIDDFLYAVIITEDSKEDIDYEEAFNYLKTLKNNFILNEIVLVRGEYIGREDVKSKLIYDLKNKKILLCSEPSKPLKECINIIDKEEEKKKFKIKDSLATNIIILINIIIFIITAIMSRSIVSINTGVLIECGAKVNYLINDGQVWRLLTCAFLHGGLMHIIFNMYSLFVVGTVVEKIYGWKKYLGIYFLSALTSSILSYLLAPFTISVGASGAIFGVLGAFLWFALKEKERLYKGVLGNIIAVILLNLYIGFTSSSIDNLGHIGGFIGGFLIAILLYKRK